MRQRSFIADIALCLRFYSRLPVPPPAGEDGAEAMFDFSRATPAVPIAGALIGACGALMLLIASAIGLPPLVSAFLALATLAAVTGALHEDGLADCADGFGGGRTRSDKLAIMKDSRIGAYGAAALVLAFSLRAAALAALLGEGATRAALAVVAAAAVSRMFGLLPLVLLAPARADGVGRAAGRPRGRPLAVSVVLALFCGLAPMLVGMGFGHVLAAIFASAAAAFAVTRVADRVIGGQTGDVAGAAQQFAEIAFLCALAAAPRP